ncbi:MAG: type II toxin-antitoxin system VapC family toxin [Pseudomonadota bacterium]
MELIEILKENDVYFDTNIFIYLLEGNETYIEALDDIRRLITINQIRVFSSDLIYTEILPYHARQNNQEAIEYIIDFLDNFEIVRISKNVAIHAGILRGETGMKTPDALHIATAMNEGCNLFLTNDAGISVPDNMQRILLSDFCTK